MQENANINFAGHDKRTALHLAASEGHLEAVKVMMAAHQQGVCVVAVFPRDVAETKATRATDAAKANGFPLMFATEPEA